MPRADLLALSPDDLVTLTNRGTVRRAQREIEENVCKGDIHETPEGDVTVRWSDGVECRLPAGIALRDARCSCDATTICRHLVLSVLAYHRLSTASSPAESGKPGQAATVVAPWDPGTISDEELTRHINAARLARCRAQFEKGVLVELVRSSKPSARFHLEACLVRFLVPGDLRYTHCDCAEQAPCFHVPLAIWAFRKLPESEKAGIVSSGSAVSVVPVEVLDRVETTLLEFCEQGVSGAPAGWRDRLARLEADCKKADLVWPGEIVAELIEQQERYDGHDARFAPDEVAELAGELLIRCDAIRRDTGALPQLLIRGTSADCDTALGSATFVGLGCGFRAARRRIVLTAYLQDTDSGTLTAVTKSIPDEPDPSRSPRPFSDMALTGAIGGTSFAALGAGKLTMQGGKRTARHFLKTTRAKAGVTPQRFEWERLKPPVLVEEFAELQARLSALPPSSLRPRRVAEDFYVCAVAGTRDTRFEAATQTIQATLLDAREETAHLVFPYTSRGRQGAEALLAALGNSGANLRFVSGPVKRSAGGLVIEPVCLVFQEGEGRVALQPWVDARPAKTGEAPLPEQSRAIDALADCLQQMQAGLEELLVLGLRRAEGLVARRWRELQQRTEATGLARLAAPARQLADELEKKAHDLRWDWRPAAAVMLRLAVLLRMAADLVA